MNSATKNEIDFCLSTCETYGLNTKKVFLSDYPLLKVLYMADAFGEIPEDNETQEQIEQLFQRAEN